MSRRLALALAWLLAAPFVIDGIVWSFWQQRLIRFADAVALEAADTALAGGDPLAAARDMLRDEGIAGAIEHPPRSGDYRGHPFAVRVRVAVRRAPPLTAFLWGEGTLRASVTAARIDSPDQVWSGQIARVE